MRVTPVDVLRQVPLLADLDEAELERLSRRMKERTFPEGATVTREGEGGVGFFLIAEGEAKVSVAGAQKGRLGPGDHFGEIALIDEGGRTATITAETDLRCLGMTAWEFRPFVREQPAVAWKLLQTLARRLRAARPS